MRQYVVRSLVVVLAATAACGGGEEPIEAPRTGPTVRDSAGARIVFSAEPRWSPGEGWAVSPEPAVRIGVVDGAQPYLFDGIAGVTRLSDGTIVVLDEGSAQVRYYTPAGRHIRSVGRPGRGPGELRAPRWLQRLEGDIVQITHTDGRIRYGPDGELVADDRMLWTNIHSVGRAAAPEGSAGFLMESCEVDTPLFLGEDVLLCGSTYNDVRFLPDTPGLHESISLVARADWALEAVDTIGVFARYSLVRYRAAGRLYSARLDPPYGPRGRMSVSGSPPRLLYVDTRSYRVESHPVDGSEPVLVMERAGGLRTPTDVELASFDRAFRPVAFGDSTRLMHPPGDPDDFRREVTPVDSVSIIALAPYVDATGATWVPLEAPPRTPERAFDVFDAGGVWLGQVVAPYFRFTIHEIGEDYILGDVRDELGVEFVVMYRLER